MKDKIVIGIAGGSGSGKTTIAESLIGALGSEKCSLLKQDNYYKDQSHLNYEDRNKLNFDNPDMLDNNLLKKHIISLSKNCEVHIPIYDFKTHTRQKEYITLYPREIILLEGILLFSDSKVRNLINIKIFIDTDSDIRFIRRLKRDVLERGRNIDSVINQYLSSVKVMHDKFVEPSMKYADIVVSGNKNISDIFFDIKKSLEKEFNGCPKLF